MTWHFSLIPGDTDGPVGRAMRKVITVVKGAVPQAKFEVGHARGVAVLRVVVTCEGDATLVDQTQHAAQSAVDELKWVT